MVKRGPVVPSLFTADMTATLRFYEDVLGFTQTGKWEDEGQITWAEVKRDDATIWFFANQLDAFPSAVFSGLIYVFVDAVDALAAALKDKVEFSWGPETQDYGLRELGLKDNNNYYLVFAQEID